MRGTIVAALLAWFPSTALGASILIDSIPTPELPGYRTYTFSMRLDPDEEFRAIDASFAGPMHQVNPSGSSTVFTDNNALFDSVGALPAQDSQFLFSSTDGSTVVIDAGESAASLEGVVLPRPLPTTNPVPFAQIVKQPTTRLEGRVWFAFDPVADSVLLTVSIPEPSTLATLIASGVYSRLHRGGMAQRSPTITPPRPQGAITP